MKTFRRVAILGGARIPFARQNTAYAAIGNQAMLTAAFAGVVRRFGLEGASLGEVAGGAVLKHSRDTNLAREAALDAGLSPLTPAYDVQQACATSLQAALAVGNKIALGTIDAGLAGGVDSASDVPIAVGEPFRRLLLRLGRARGLGERLGVLASFRPGMLVPSIPSVTEKRTGLSMGEHCEQMVRRWGVSREAQDALALASHLNAVKAYSEGFYDDLLVPFAGLERDNALRPDTSLERLARLKPAFDRTSGHGTLTAGNSTPLTDGAAAVLLASEAWAAARGHAPLAWLVDAESAAVDYFGPDAEGLLMAPAHAVPRLLERNGLKLQDFDLYEIHEAFAGQVLCTLAAWEDPAYCREKLGLPGALGAIARERLNPKGGSLALGHPFAATGARLLAATAKQLAALRVETGRPARALISVCAAGGLGVAAILES